MTKVALVKSGDRLAAAARAIDLLGENPARGKSVLVKPNYNSADPTPGSTHEDTLRALIAKLKEMGATDLLVADRSGMGDTRATLKKRGVFRLAEEMGFGVQVLDELGQEGWLHLDPPDSHWRRGYALPRLIEQYDTVVETCCLKTHRFGGHFTLSLKNSVGLAARTVPGEGYNYMTELHSSPHQRQMIAEINWGYKPTLVLLDGVEAFVDGGPDVGTRKRPEVTLAGTDRIAVDAVGVAILRMLGTTPQVSEGRIFRQAQIARAVELGLGVQSPAEIDIVTPDEASENLAAQVRSLLQAEG